MSALHSNQTLTSRTTVVRRERLLWNLELANGQSIRAHRFPFTLGRGRESDLCLSSKSVSTRHAVLLESVGAITVRDLESTNGTRVNGKTIDVAALSDGDVVELGDEQIVVSAERPDETDTSHGPSPGGDVGLVLFDQLLSADRIQAYFQPIINLHTGHTIGGEALSRSSLITLENPRPMFEVAALTNQEAELSRECRRATLASCPFQSGHSLFLNIHPLELEQPGLVESLENIKMQLPEIDIVAELGSVWAAKPSKVIGLRAELDRLGIRLAYQNFGRGISDIRTLSEAPPEILKFDQKLIGGIHAAPGRQTMMRSLINMAKELNCLTVAVGIEIEEELATCKELGFDFGQGFALGRPQSSKEWLKSTRSAQIL